MPGPGHIGATRRVRRAGDPSGFTLVEVLVAAMILALALLALSSLFALGLKNNGISKEDTVMAALAQDKLEQLRRHTRDELDRLYFEVGITPTCKGYCASGCAPCAPLPAGCSAATCCANLCYPRDCASANRVARRTEDPTSDPNSQDDVRERLYVREWVIEKVNLGAPVGCVFRITVTVGSRNGLLAPTPTSAKTWPGAIASEVVGNTNPRRVILSTYRR